MVGRCGRMVCYRGAFFISAGHALADATAFDSSK
jgi:hypothetical protein